MSQRIGSSALALTRVWHHIDLAADPRTMGRIATSIALTLQGKHKPTFSPNRDHGDYVVVTNASHLKVTGNKLKEKTYWSHTTRPGSLKLIPMERMIANKGHHEVLKRAVKNMLPRNKLKWARLDRLLIFDGDEHPYKENLIAFADEIPDYKKKVVELEEKEKNIQKLREQYLAK